jgi:hypothetical protein
VRLSLNGDVIFFEGDFSKFDQSQGYGALNLEVMFFTKLLGEDIGPLLWATFCKELRTYDELNNITVKIQRKRNPSRNSGGMDTTLGNSIVNFMTWLLVIFTSDIDHFEERFLFFGFKIKMKRHADLRLATFLKGGFVNQGEKWYWFPLPSRVLKIFKCSGLIIDYYPQLKYEQGVEAYLHSLATQLVGYALPPLISTFFKKYNRVVYSHSAQLIELDWHIVNKSSDSVLILPEYLFHHFLLQRYNITPNDIQNMEYELEHYQVNHVFSPLFEKLCCDYT